MTVTVYGRGQMVMPAKARKAAGIQKGDVFSVEVEDEGRLVLVRMEVPKLPKYRIVQRKGKHPIVVGGRRITSQMVKQWMEELP